MTFKQKSKDQIRQHEGCLYVIYSDHLGFKTFGVGHFITSKDVEFGQPIGTPVTSERVEDVFDKDWEVSLETAKRLVGNFDSHPENVQLVLVNMAFNLGYNRLKKFQKFIGAVTIRDYQGAALEMMDSKWYTQVGNRSKELVKLMENPLDEI